MKQTSTRKRAIVGLQKPQQSFRKLTPAEAKRQAEDRLKLTLAASTRVIVIDNVAEGSRATIKRARVADPLDRIDLPDRCHDAATVFRQAYEHLEAGRSLGPMPWAKDRVDESSFAGDLPASMLVTTSAATWYRRGVQAMGLAASQGVVNWVVICGLPLSAYDSMRRWRKGRGKEELIAALVRLRDVYFPAVEGVVRETGLFPGVDA